MKRIYLVLVFILTVGLVSCQEKNKDQKRKDKEEVPAAVASSFKEKYPGEDDPYWEQDDHGYWESHFKKDGEKYRADFNADGTWVETENSIKKEDLPEVVKKIIEEKYSEYEIAEVEHVDNAKKGEFYDVEFKQEGKNMDVEFKEDGTIINR